MDIQPSTHYHSQVVNDFNSSRQGQVPIDLSEAALLAEASKETGLDRLGDESFLPAMRALLTSLEADAQLNPFGRFVAKSRSLNALRNRLWANACFEAHPEIRQRKLPAPIVVIGPHRSGTTRMHSMMAADARLRHLQAWEGINPAPRLGQPDAGKAARFDEVKQMLDTRAGIYPGA